MHPEAETICAVATPPGDGAIGVVRVSGPAAVAQLLELCGGDAPRPRRLTLARLRSPVDGATIDRAMVCVMPAPSTYTGEDVVEVHGHGGRFNLQRILEGFIALGARMAEPGEFTRRAFLNGRMDLCQAEGVLQVITARSEAAHRNAQALLGGALGACVAALRDEVVELVAHLEVYIDFAEEVEGGVPVERLRSEHERVERSIARVAATYARGRRLAGIRAALVGPVNVGKSSLFNRLLGRERAVVADHPGTTRDYLEEELLLEGQRVLLIDTVGERAAPERSFLEEAGRAIAAPIISQSDLVISVVDLSDPAAPARVERRSGPQLVVGNKLDLAAAGALEALRGALELPVVGTSALSGAGLEELSRAILAQGAGEQRDSAESVLVSRERHYQALDKARHAVRQGQVALEGGLAPELVVEHSREALEALGTITGEIYTEAVLDEVFGEFCIGK
jgi:tRNA modification GTPase